MPVESDSSMDSETVVHPHVKKDIKTPLAHSKSSKNVDDAVHISSDKERATKSKPKPVYISSDESFTALGSRRNIKLVLL